MEEKRIKDMSVEELKAEKERLNQKLADVEERKREIEQVIDLWEDDDEDCDGEGSTSLSSEEEIDNHMSWSLVVFILVVGSIVGFAIALLVNNLGLLQ